MSSDSNRLSAATQKTDTVAQLPFEPDPVGTLDAHQAIHREAAVVRWRPRRILLASSLPCQVACHEGAHDTSSHARLHLGNRRIKFEDGTEADVRSSSGASTACVEKVEAEHSGKPVSFRISQHDSKRLSIPPLSVRRHDQKWLDK